MRSLPIFHAAALFEIAGCFAFWAWLRQGRSSWLLLPGVVCLVLFAWCLTRIDAPFAGRTYAAYGGIYIASSLIWLRGVEGVTPDRWDLIGSAVCVPGALVIVLEPRA